MMPYTLAFKLLRTYRNLCQERSDIMNPIPILKQDGRDQISALPSKANEYILNSKAHNTIKAYKSDWKHFSEWCTNSGCASLPAEVETIAHYITFCAEYHKVTTIQRRLTSIREAHKAAGVDIAYLENPTLKALWNGVKRTKGVKATQKQPFLVENFGTRSKVQDSNRSMRDSAMLLIGFAGAFRRSELVSINVEDIVENANGLEIELRRSKTDQDGKGMIKAIPYGSNPDLCPVRAYKAWLIVLNRSQGPLFVRIRKGDVLTDSRISDKAVSLIIKEAIGTDSDKYSGHSLRIGFVTQAALNGASDRSIMNQTGHRSRATVDRYVKRITIWQDNAATRLGL